jgi:hypothetical protein
MSGDSLGNGNGNGDGHDSARDRIWPEAVVRGRVGPWGRRLVYAATAVVATSWLLRSETVAPGVPQAIVSVLVLVSFGALALSVWHISVRWRISLRSDGRALVVRDPLGARVLPRREGLSLGRWLDARNRPVHWVLHDGRLAVPLGPELDPVALEAFAYRVGLPLVDLDDAPRTRRPLGRDTPG